LWASGRLAGAVYVFDRPDPGAWELGTIFIDPELQGRGLGSLLMRFVERAQPATRTITLETPYRNAHLHQFYESVGYRKVGETTPGDHPEAADPQFHLYRYRKALPDT
jgi:GNAT superfamily N-acetyltransferase